jgi:hypothetical protein
VVIWFSDRRIDSCFTSAMPLLNVRMAPDGEQEQT